MYLSRSVVDMPRNARFNAGCPEINPPLKNNALIEDAIENLN
jgi:hypothetical protein